MDITSDSVVPLAVVLITVLYALQDTTLTTLSGYPKLKAWAKARYEGQIAEPEAAQSAVTASSKERRRHPKPPGPHGRIGDFSDLANAASQAFIEMMDMSIYEKCHDKLNGYEAAVCSLQTTLINSKVVSFQSPWEDGDVSDGIFWAAAQEECNASYKGAPGLTQATQTIRRTSSKDTKSPSAAHSGELPDLNDHVQRAIYRFREYIFPFRRYVEKNEPKHLKNVNGCIDRSGVTEKPDQFAQLMKEPTLVDRLNQWLKKDPQAAGYAREICDSIVLIAESFIDTMDADGPMTLITAHGMRDAVYSYTEAGTPLRSKQPVAVIGVGYPLHVKSVHVMGIVDIEGIDQNYAKLLEAYRLAMMGYLQDMESSFGILNPHNTAGYVSGKLGEFLEQLKRRINNDEAGLTACQRAQESIESVAEELEVRGKVASAIASKTNSDYCDIYISLL